MSEKKKRARRVPMLHDGSELHRALCEALLDEPPIHGTKTAIAERLELRPQYYSRIISSRIAILDTIAKWCSMAGVSMHIDNYQVTYCAPGEDWQAPVLA